MPAPRALTWVLALVAIGTVLLVREQHFKLRNLKIAKQSSPRKISIIFTLPEQAFLEYGSPAWGRTPLRRQLAQLPTNHLLQQDGEIPAAFACTNGCSKNNNLQSRLADSHTHKLGALVADTGFNKPPIEWLHIPKAGTSFGNTLIAWACPELEPGLRILPHKPVNITQECLARFRVEPDALPIRLIGDHYSLRNRTEAELARVFTLLRSPAERHVSGFFYTRGRWGKGNGPQRICQVARESTLIHTARGTQTKLIVGEALEWEGKYWRHYPSAAPPSEAQVREACRRLQVFAFVGISDFWDATVCLFHAQHGGEAREMDHANVRKGGYLKTAATSEVDCGDSADQRVYRCALAVFHNRLGQFPQCKQHMGS